ncbi:vitamin K epoxide reductase family protein [Lentzea tibetensis]|uniref:Vitamin K epoxide reductase family protein n=1 Tax=Lentzea tibetensis TaxID=2591470 RepID=A0A563EES5_9PSEU|nr:vitamin K epoxide reductase family protein [Lentzea tibetensis]TWP43404.1 vitamin K epoxide reductase family protein [Lentzea tibetensis]
MTARLSLLLSFAGLLVSGYLTYAHFNADALVCAESALIDCAAVTSSEQSKLFGIPVALLGLLFFAAMTVLCLPRVFRVEKLRWVRLGAVGVGVLMVVYLVAAELLLIGKICLWCTVVHVLTLVLAGLLVSGALRPSSLEPPLPDSRPPGVPR